MGFWIGDFGLAGRGEAGRAVGLSVEVGRADLPEVMDRERLATGLLDLVEWAQEGRRQKEPQSPALRDVVIEFLGKEPGELQINRRTLHGRDLPTAQAALEAWMGRPGLQAQLVGFLVEFSVGAFGFSQALARTGYNDVRVGPTSHTPVQLPTGTVLCLERGVYLVEEAFGRYCVLVHNRREYGETELAIEVLSADRTMCSEVLDGIEAEIVARSVYRGEVISLGGREATDIVFHNIEPIGREDIILPEGLLATIDRNAIEFAASADALRDAGMHVKRGLLLHGPPGTGKTLSIRYLISQMPGRTTIIVAGARAALLREACELARTLAPATVVLEDVDLFAEDRESAGDSCQTSLLFDLLNEMDGLPGDCDVLFVLTTNRPGAIEPALAARPGRIDQAIEFPLPDADCRSRLFALYGEGLNLGEGVLEGLVSRTEGASPAFIRELIRKGTLLALLASEGEMGGVSGEHLEAALREMVTEGGELTRKLLGAGPGVGRGS